MPKEFLNECLHNGENRPESRMTRMFRVVCHVFEGSNNQRVALNETYCCGVSLVKRIQFESRLLC